MLKIIYSLIFCCINVATFAQTKAEKKELNKLATNLAAQMCDCFNNNRDQSTDKELIKLIDIMQKKDDGQADAYVAKLPTKKQIKISNAITVLEELDNRTFDGCLYDKTVLNVEKYKAAIQSKEILVSLLPQFKKQKKCKLFYTIVALPKE